MKNADFAYLPNELAGLARPRSGHKSKSSNIITTADETLLLAALRLMREHRIDEFETTFSELSEVAHQEIRRDYNAFNRLESYGILRARRSGNRIIISYLLDPAPAYGLRGHAHRRISLTERAALQSEIAKYLHVRWSRGLTNGVYFDALFKTIFSVTPAEARAQSRSHYAARRQSLQNALQQLSVLPTWSINEKNGKYIVKRCEYKSHNSNVVDFPSRDHSINLPLKTATP